MEMIIQFLSLNSFFYTSKLLDYTPLKFVF